MLAVFALILVAGCTGQGQAEQKEFIGEKGIADMKITSSAFANGGAIPQAYSCDGGDKIPPLKFEGVTAAAKSLVLIVDDPDAPVGTWDHWILFNIPPGTGGVEEGKEPGWPHGKNSWGRAAWGGPCPPDREHRYFFRLYALDKILGLEEGADRQALLKEMEGHILAKAELMGKYQRP